MIIDKFLDRLLHSNQKEKVMKVGSGMMISKNISININKLKNQILVDCCDVKYKEITIKLLEGELSGVLIFVDGLVDKQVINRDILRPLLSKKNLLSKNNFSKISVLQQYLHIDDISSDIKLSSLTDNLFSGSTILIIDTFTEFLILNTKGFSDRAIEESKIEHVIRGPKDGFIENLRTNTSLIRRKIKDPKLKIRELTIGERTKTTVAILFVEELVNQNLLDDILSRIKKIKINGVFETAYIEQHLEESPYSMFPQMQTTERPDKVCSNLLEGKIAIFVDGSPDCLLLPITFSQLFQSPDDYYERLLYGNFLRLIRYLGFLITTSFPAFYVALTTFHQDVLPTDLAFSIAKSRIGVPYPPVIEVVLMEVTIELLREASARLPASIGQTIGIVGAIVLGDAAVRANLVSPIMVIVVAITALGAYIVPYYSTSYALRFIRIPMVVSAATFGAYGMIITWCWILAHLCRLSSFGFPYLSPFSPSDPALITDSLLRKPLYNQQTTPKTKRTRRAK
ncbi:spore germination protein [Alkalicella caledoniensis]|uniref:Spore germination protein n=1 Tax=Alkalicella caledoniensis TaxID=2731377 RepID=A0A7G9WBD2_ALKCA|nr:spore germination protein [Alkalicella caledoniensis]QNO15994.1 spore germination protein [Alkalicella caledoniensis]